ILERRFHLKVVVTNGEMKENSLQEDGTTSGYKTDSRKDQGKRTQHEVRDSIKDPNRRPPKPGVDKPLKVPPKKGKESDKQKEDRQNAGKML
ncbi:MAG: hypothetical protein ACYTG4_12050, partial [Planctomycetota bacterium]